MGNSTNKKYNTFNVTTVITDNTVIEDIQKSLSKKPSNKVLERNKKARKLYKQARR